MIRDMGSLAMKPVPNKWIVTFRYGVTYSGTRKKHKGVDYSCPKGTSVNSAVSGKVVFAGWHKVGRGWGRSYGQHIIIDNDRFKDGSAGLWAGYCHLSKINVKVGQRVNAGDQIGEVGSTGNSTGSHLHFEIQSGRLWKGWAGSRNPQRWIDA
jgi:murein DD-endopeptidase MepM/ murein hydrolase activator NlpD